MNEFERDCYRRKQLTYSARHRKNGSKSKKCDLTSDRLTRKEWEQQNGSVTTYYLGYPAKWEDFQYWPHSVQTEYINSLVNQYRVTDAHIADMLGISDAAFMKYRQTKIPDASVKEPGYHMSDQETQSWKIFIQLDRDTEEVNKMVMDHDLGRDRPMSKKAFMALTKENQERILRYWQTTYGANGGDIARMMGWKASCLNSYIHGHNLNVTFHRGVKMTHDQREKWEDMLNGRITKSAEVDIPSDKSNVPAENADTEFTKEDYDRISMKGLDYSSTTYDEYMARKDSAKKSKKLPQSDKPLVEEPAKAVMRERKFVFKGEFTSNEILDAIASVLGNGDAFRGEFEIACKMSTI